MTRFMCSNCGHQYADSATAPSSCAICSDERQYVHPNGQSWTTHEALRADHHVRFETDGDLLGLGISPAFGIPQRALHLQTDAGNILWECLSLVTPEAVETLERRGGVDMIVISHPHFYSAMVDWSDALGGVPILLHENDRRWISRTSPNIRLWSGDVHPLSPTVSLYRCPGHFPGSTVLHWTAAPNDRRVLLAGDALHVTADRRHVTFMYSVPNYIPAHPDFVAETRRRVEPLDFDDVYGFTWGLNVLGNAKDAVDESFDRYFTAIGQESRLTVSA